MWKFSDVKVLWRGSSLTQKLYDAEVLWHRSFSDTEVLWQKFSDTEKSITEVLWHNFSLMQKFCNAEILWQVLVPRIRSLAWKIFDENLFAKLSLVKNFLQRVHVGKYHADAEPRRIVAKWWCYHPDAGVRRLPTLRLTDPRPAYSDA